MRILIVEDDTITQAMVRGILVKAGYEVDSVYNCKQAMECDFESYDLILMDWWLPDGSGVNLAKHIRKDQPSHDQYCPYILMLTGSKSASDMDYALSNGVNSYTAKPINGQDLLEYVKFGCQVSEEFSK